MNAYDLGEPRLSTRGLVTVNVDRNRFPPEILNLYHETDIAEDRQVTQVQNPSSSVYDVIARDNDTVVSSVLINFDISVIIYPQSFFTQKLNIVETFVYKF